MENVKNKRLTEYLVDNQARFYRYAYSFTKNREQALDAVQNAVCSALEHKDSLRNIDAVRSWFYRILVNECMNMHRKYGKEIPYEQEHMEVEYTDDDPTNGEELYALIQRLPVKTQTVIKLRFFEELTLKEISEATDENLSTVKSRLYAGLDKLKILVVEEGIGE